MGIHLLTAQVAFLSCGLVTLGLIFFVVGVLGARTGRSSLRWPGVPGEVLDSRVGWDPLSGRNTAQVRYRYSVNKHIYQAGRVSFRQGIPLTGPHSAQAQAEAARYQPGQAVTVYYNPADPSEAVLEPGADNAAMIPLGVGGLFFVLGLIAGIAALLQ